MKLIPAGMAVLLAVTGFAQQKPKNADIENIGHRNINGGQINLMSAEKEKQLGSQLSAEYESKVRLAADPALTEYIGRIGQKIVANSDATAPVTFKVVESDVMSAQAFPGYVYINTGTILAADNEAELAFVLAQQVAHIAARHTAELAAKTELVNRASSELPNSSQPPRR